jgi:hypothetical protein
MWDFCLFFIVEIPHQNSKSKTYKQKYQGNNTKNEHQQKYENEIPRKEKPQHINPALSRSIVIRLKKYCVCIWRIEIERCIAMYSQLNINIIIVIIFFIILYGTIEAQ